MTNTHCESPSFFSLSRLRNFSLSRLRKEWNEWNAHCLQETNETNDSTLVSLFSQVLFLQEKNETRIVVVSWSNRAFMNQCDPSIICNIEVLIKKSQDTRFATVIFWFTFHIFSHSWVFKNIQSSAW
jgi:hypothetical protein